MRTISPTDLAALGADALIIDVREPDEFTDARVTGAVNIPLGTLSERLDEVPRDRTVHVMCLSGGRSARATAYLASEGVAAVDVEGGIANWYQSGLPVDRGAAA